MVGLDSSMCSLAARPSMLSGMLIVPCWSFRLTNDHRRSEKDDDEKTNCHRTSLACHGQLRVGSRAANLCERNCIFQGSSFARDRIAKTLHHFLRGRVDISEYLKLRPHQL